MRFYTDDPARDFDRWDMEQARAEARLPVCECCGEVIHDDNYFEIDNEILCRECVEDKYMKSTEDFIQID
jgi:formylmethanofuran dehydrogenase subunit E